MIILIAFGVLFFIGAIPTAYLAGKALQGKDIRQFGSGNVGATNAFRVLGKKAGVFVFFIDFLKGFVPIFFAARFFSSGHPYFIELGFGPILGHIFTPFLNFKGGKGVATSLGVIAFIFPQIFIIAILVWGVIFIITRIVSISSLFSIGSILFSAALLHKDEEEFFFLGILFCLLLWTHRENIKRLITGSESRFSK